MILEACVESYSEAIAFQLAGAGRIELCENLFVGGTTPSYGTIKMCCNNLNIPVATMIRPRGGDFCYSDDEFSIMQEDVKVCKALGSQGVVFGMLTKENKIDVERTKILVNLAGSMQTVFHKAFDEVNDPFEALEQLIEIGITRILTSGTKETAFEGQEILRKLIKQAAGRITILAAGKVTFENLQQLQEIIPASEFHGKRIVKVN
ncbi:MAG TPA: copper homeostasis protein CutC [Bacteroidales bacterium]|nr:copper homeostasis protein CutC [Bacteroidales bacterium]